MGNENNNSNTITSGGQTAPVEVNSSEVSDVAQQMQQGFSRYSQESQSYQETLVALLKQVGGQLQATDAKVTQESSKLDRLTSQFRNSRS